MLKRALAVGLAAAGLWLAVLPADAQWGLRCRHDRAGCFDRCGVIVVRQPDGTVEVQENLTCMAECNLCPIFFRETCTPTFACMDQCSREDPQTRQLIVDRACVERCPACP
jgi:hypothetical protein